MSSPFSTLDIGNSDARIIIVTNIDNLDDIKPKLAHGSLSVSLLNAKQILNAWQVQLAGFKAYKALKENKLTTRTVYSEIIYNLYPTRQISQAYKVFAMPEHDNCCVAVTVGDKCQQDMEDLLKLIPNAKVLSFYEHINKFNDKDAIKKTYKIQDNELLVGTLSDAVVSRIAAKELLL